jgi:hypothetical protein
MAGRTSPRKRSAKQGKRKPQTQREAEGRRRPVSKRQSPRALGAREKSRRNIPIGPGDRDGRSDRRERDVERERYEGSGAGNRDIERDPVGHRSSIDL